MIENNRTFPQPDQDTLKAHIYHSNRLERIPMNLETINKAYTNKEPNPYAEGHFKAISLIMQLATNQNLLPEKITSVYYINQEVPWLKRLHRNLMNPIAEYGQMTLDSSYIHPFDVGKFRQTHKSIKRETETMIIDVPMPDPMKIEELMLEMLNDLCKFNQDMKRTIDYGRYSKDDVDQLVDKAYETNLKICCIKPFEDGSNRLARLTENLLRLNWGLPWKIITLDDKDEYLRDIRKMQDNF